ncbi:hypothetical protein Bbelb_429200 [Branchiostoma belcheri]|nr:hypothetical protein Bbelb_429200 [Branchiostoma belcheri]
MSEMIVAGLQEVIARLRVRSLSPVCGEFLIDRHRWFTSIATLVKSDIGSICRAKVFFTLMLTSDNWCEILSKVGKPPYVSLWYGGVFTDSQRTQLSGVLRLHSG